MVVEVEVKNEESKYTRTIKMLNINIKSMYMYVCIVYTARARPGALGLSCSKLICFTYLFRNVRRETSARKILVMVYQHTVHV